MPHQIRHLDYISQFTTDMPMLQQMPSCGEVPTPSTLTPPPQWWISVSWHWHRPRTQTWPDYNQPHLSALSVFHLLSLMASSLSVMSPPAHSVRTCPRPLGEPSLTHYMQCPTLAHGIHSTQRLVTSRFVWPNINADVRCWAHSCPQCQRAKVHRHTTTPLGTFTTPDARFDHVHVDLLGPLPPSNGCVYLLTCIDRFTRWPEAIPIPDATANTAARAFTQTWSSRFGVPSTVTSDRDAQFESRLWKALSELLGVKHSRMTSYHPITNGLVERFHRQLKAALKASP